MRACLGAVRRASLVHARRRSVCTAASESFSIVGQNREGRAIYLDSQAPRPFLYTFYCNIFFYYI